MNKYGKLYKFVRKELIKRLEAMKRNSIWLVKYLSNDKLVLKLLKDEDYLKEESDKVAKLFENEEEKGGFFGNNIIAKHWLKIYFDKDSEFSEWDRRWMGPYYSGDDNNFDYDGFALLIIEDTASQLLMNCRTYRFNIDSCNTDEWYGHPYNIIKKLKEAA